MIPIRDANIWMRYVYKDGILYTVNHETMKMTPSVIVKGDGHVYTTDDFSYAHVIWIMHHGTPVTAQKHAPRGTGYPSRETAYRQYVYEIAMCRLLRWATTIQMRFKDGDILNCALDNLEPLGLEELFKKIKGY